MTPPVEEEIPAPLPGDALPGRRYSLCAEAVSAALDALAGRAEAAGWTPGEVAAAAILWGAARSAGRDGPEAAGEILMLAMDEARMSEPQVR